MIEEDVTNPDEPVETEEQEVTDEPEPNVNDEGDGEEGDEESEPEEEQEEIEHEGRKYSVPKSLKPLLMFQADYTRKTQEVAEQRKALDSDRQSLAQQAQQQQAFIQDFAKIEALTQRIGEYDKVNWQQLNAQDPVRAQALWFEYGQLKDQRSALAQTLQQKQQEQALAQQRERAKRVEEGQALLRKEIPNYGPELMSKLSDFAVSHGYTAEEVAAVMDPRAVKLLNLAYIGHQLAEKQRKAMTKPKTQEAKPVPTVQSKGKPDMRLRDDISVEEWTRRRNAQIAARGR